MRQVLPAINQLLTTVAHIGTIEEGQGVRGYKLASHLGTN